LVNASLNWASIVGIVLAVGDGPPDLAGFKMPVAPVDHVVFQRSAGVWVEIEDERLLVCRMRSGAGVRERRVHAAGARVRGAGGVGV
jgi:co-chaperonin GroES (HSP10)